MKAHTQRSIGRLVGIMVIIVVAGILIARSYYGNLNRSVDPRIKQARELYEQYDKFARAGDYYLIFTLLDSISIVYLGVPHYAESFELGVLHNNRAAAMLTIAIYGDSIPETLNPFLKLHADSIVAMAENNIRSAISIYEGWNQRFDGKDDEKIRQMIEREFMDGLKSIDPDLVDKYLDTRVKEIVKAQLENKRRLSVCHTNMGLVHRLREEYPEAVAEYEMALTLWERNLDAENNLNKLLGRPLKKRNIIQKLFPPDKELSTKK
jgi:tetratricopeptide (TPR) repeat protein